jgi:hypothetical protein
MWSMASAAAFQRAYRHATQEAFLKAHALPQPVGGQEENPARIPPGRNGAVHPRSHRDFGAREKLPTSAFQN